jgi:5'-3' exonuclease
MKETILIDMDIIVYRAGHGAKGDFIMNIEKVHDIIDPVIERFTGYDYRGFISGPRNFRTKVAKIKKYKGNRDSSSRPRYYDAIREYMINFLGVEVSDGIEADDILGILQNDNTIICSIDKDLNMVPGMHYNFNMKELYYISPEEGVYNFLRQMLTGDPSDNIPGINRIGDVKSERLLQGKTPKELYCKYEK